MTDKDAVLRKRCEAWWAHANDCDQCRPSFDANPRGDEQEMQPIPNGLCDDGRALLITAWNVLWACDICSVYGLGWGRGSGIWRMTLEHVDSGQGRAVRFCDQHLGAFAKHLEERWPWGTGAFMHEPNDPACAGSCHGKWKWAGAVQRWFAPLFGIVASEVARQAWGIFRPPDR